MDRAIVLLFVPAGTSATRPQIAVAGAAAEKVKASVAAVTGLLAEPIRWKVKDSVITEVAGGSEVGEERQRLCKQVLESNHLIEIMFGYYPKASAQHVINDPMHWELISKMPWAVLGTPRKHPNFRHRDGSVYNGRLYIRDRLVVDTHGMLDPPSCIIRKC